MKQDNETVSVAFIDMLFILLIFFIVILALIQINPESVVKPAIETRGKFLITIQWEDGSRDDVDIYVQGPDGKIAYFQSRNNELMHLEYDDRGTVGDKVVSSVAGEVILDRNEERVVLRGTIPGEYTVNVHMFRKTETQPTHVKAALYQLIGSDKELHRTENILTVQGQEATAFRFTVTETEFIRGINDLPKPIMGRLNDPRFGGQR